MRTLPFLLCLSWSEGYDDGLHRSGDFFQTIAWSYPKPFRGIGLFVFAFGLFRFGRHDDFLIINPEQMSPASFLHSGLILTVQSTSLKMYGAERMSLKRTRSAQVSQGGNRSDLIMTTSCGSRWAFSWMVS